MKVARTSTMTSRTSIGMQSVRHRVVAAATVRQIGIVAREVAVVGVRVVVAVVEAGGVLGAVAGVVVDTAAVTVGRDASFRYVK